MKGDDFKNLDWHTANCLDDYCDDFYELSKEERRKGVEYHYGDFFIIDEEVRL